MISSIRSQEELRKPTRIASVRKRTMCLIVNQFRIGLAVTILRFYADVALTPEQKIIVDQLKAIGAEKCYSSGRQGMIRTYSS